jgi:hypothetical protein
MTPVGAQQEAPPDARWLPWIGCWRPAGQQSLDGSLRVCVVPAGAAGARIMTVAGGAVAAEETIIPDGAAHPSDEPSCRGSRRSEWSPDGLRLYASAELTCADQPARKVSGLSTLTTGGEWIDVQVVVSGSQERVRVRRYERSHDQPPDPSLIPLEVAASAAKSPPGARLTIAQVTEASSRVLPRVLEALIFETKSTFPIDRKELIAMDDGGVPDEVIDVMVALSFPRKFNIRRSTGASSWGGFSYFSLSPFGFPYWSVDGDYYYPGWGIDAGGGGVVLPAEAHGRAVNGRGYTQVDRAQDNTGQSMPRTRTGDGGSAGAAESGSSSSGGASAATSSGYSSESSGGDSGRTAVPR